MKKIKLLIISVLFLVPFSVFAKPKVLTLTANTKDNIISYSGTTENDAHAVMCKLYNSKNVEQDLLSSEVNNNEFSGSFKVKAAGDYSVACANYEGGEIKKVEANISEEEISQVIKKYETKDDSGNSISFAEELGHTFSLFMMDYLPLTDEDLEKLEINKEEYNQVKEKIANATKANGDLLAVYEIIVTDENGQERHNGEFEIKIKLTEEMKKYTTFKLFYIKDDYTTEDPIELSVEGDYLVGTLPHLSTYALVGNISTPVSNPVTNDNIMMWIGMLCFSFSGVALGLIIVKKRLKTKCK